ncbi:hypothetical protein C8Q80DRAFT_1105942 [Daedaleopsis nitida]|nr:hypothetical protein C8Q80DRAFT_1105942 [Daedaleopsis nitida]
MVCLSLASFLSLATVVYAAPSLVLQLSGSSLVGGRDDFKVITTATNAGHESVKLLNDPRSPLSDLPTDVFTIRHIEHGKKPDFVGIHVKYVPDLADDSEFTMLAPGQSVQVEHNVLEAYDFSQSGPGPYIVTVKSNTAPFYSLVEGQVVTLAAETNEAFHVVNVTGSSRSKLRTQASLEMQDCEDWQTQAIEGAIPLAEQYAANAHAYLQREGFESDNYKHWFGDADGTRLSTVASHFQALRDNNFGDFKYVCNTEYCARKPNVYAYVYADMFGQVHVCGQFFRAPVGGRDSRASTIVHESSHFIRNGGTEDHAYGNRLCEDLARNHPELAVMNADNHEYYAVGANGDGGDVASALRNTEQTYMGVKGCHA